MDFHFGHEFQMLLFEEHPDGIFMLSSSGVFLAGNPAAERIIGYSKEELIGKNFTTMNLLPASQIPRAGLMITKILAGSSVESQEFTLVRKDKSRVEVELKSRKIKLENEWRILGSVRDISYRKNALDLIKLSEEKYSSIFMNSTDGIIYLDKKGKILDANPMLMEILGKTAEDLIGHKVVELARHFLTARQLPKVMKSIGQMLTGKTVSGFTLEYNDRIIEISIPAERKRKGITAVFRDITDRLAKEDELIRSEEKFRTIVENAQPIIFVLDKKGKFLVSEGKSLARLGLQPGQVVGLSAYEVYKDFPEVGRSIETALKGKTVSNILDLGTAVFDVSFSPHRDPQGKIIGLIGMAVDITEIKLSEKALVKAKENAEESDRLKSAFIANISHEIRTPLNSILGFSELLTDPELVTSQSQKYYKIIQAGGEQLLSIINNLLEISIIESGRLKLNVEKFSLKELLSSIYTQYSGMNSDYGNRTRMVDSKDIEIKTDRVRLIQILNNLISNAIKYSDKGEILIGYTLDKAFVKFFVSDEGDGIFPGLKDKIFDRFFRIPHSDKIAKGSGLGLSITKAIVEEMGGKIWFESEPDKGTCFYFTIPR